MDKIVVLYSLHSFLKEFVVEDGITVDLIGSVSFEKKNTAEIQISAKNNHRPIGDEFPQSGLSMEINESLHLNSDSNDERNENDSVSNTLHIPISSNRIDEVVVSDFLTLSNEMTPTSKVSLCCRSNGVPVPLFTSFSKISEFTPLENGSRVCLIQKFSMKLLDEKCSLCLTCLYVPSGEALPLSALMTTHMKSYNENVVKPQIELVTREKDNILIRDQLIREDGLFTAEFKRPNGQKQGGKVISGSASHSAGSRSLISNRRLTPDRGSGTMAGKKQSYIKEKSEEETEIAKLKKRIAELESGKVKELDIFRKTTDDRRKARDQAVMRKPREMSSTPTPKKRPPSLVHTSTSPRAYNPPSRLQTPERTAITTPVQKGTPIVSNSHSRSPMTSSRINNNKAPESGRKSTDAALKRFQKNYSKLDETIHTEGTKLSVAKRVLAESPQRKSGRTIDSARGSSVRGNNLSRNGTPNGRTSPAASMRTLSASRSAVNSARSESRDKRSLLGASPCSLYRSTIQGPSSARHRVDFNSV